MAERGAVPGARTDRNEEFIFVYFAMRVFCTLTPAYRQVLRCPRVKSVASLRLTARTVTGEVSVCRVRGKRGSAGLVKEEIPGQCLCI